MEYGKRLNPERSLRMPKRIEGIRQKVIVTHNLARLRKISYGWLGSQI